MLKLYRQSQQAQIRWIRKNPVQYIALNAILLAIFIGYLEIKDRRFWRNYESNNSAANN